MKKIKSYQQGTIDYFCAVYAVINAFRWAAKDLKVLSYEEGCLFYQYLISFLLKKDLFDEVLHQGSSCSVLKKLLKKADGYTRKNFGLSLNFKMPFERTKKNIPSVLNEIRQCLEENGNAWIVRLNNQRLGDHWSVGTKISLLYRVCLFDSYGSAGFDANKALWVPSEVKNKKTVPPKGKTYLLKEGQVLLTVKKI